VRAERRHRRDPGRISEEPVEDRVPGTRDPRRRHHRHVAGRQALSALPAWAGAHPGLAPYARWLGVGRCPNLAQLNGLAREHALALPDGRPLAFVAARTGLRALEYERAIANRGEIATREGNLHDAFNAFAWLLLPRTKAALNAVHGRSAEAGTANARNRARDAATLLDESGLLLGCTDAGLVALLRERAWRELFWTRRDDVVRGMHPRVLGHGLAEKLLSPYRALTAHVLMLDMPPAPAAAGAGDATLDAMAAAMIAAPGFDTDRLTPLPVAALPGWDAEGLGGTLFDDVSVFRPPVLR
jgi:hypothetical protein